MAPKSNLQRHKTEEYEEHLKKWNGGRPKYVPREEDRVFVERAVMAGTPIIKIAAALRISKDTLRKHYLYEIITARERLKNEAVRVLDRHLKENSLEASKFVLSRVAGWNEKKAIDHTSSDGTMSPQLTNLLDEVVEE